MFADLVARSWCSSCAMLVMPLKYKGSRLLTVSEGEVSSEGRFEVVKVLTKQDEDPTN